MNQNNTMKTILASVVLLVIAVSLCEADLFRQSRPQRQMRPAAPQKRLGSPALQRRSNDNKRFSSFGLAEGEVQNFKPKFRPGRFPEPQRDGAEYDRYGNRKRYPSSDRRSDERAVAVSGSGSEPGPVYDIPRQQYRYPKPEVEEQEFLNPVPENLRREDIDAKLQSRSDDIYSPASGPAEFSDRADFGFAADGQRNIEAAVVEGAKAFGIPHDGVYQTEDRLSFQIHGNQGPHSYKYGYDTGNGYNRQFRYEERNGEGYVKGRYGFFDKYGKLQVVNYSADPITGFHAEGAGVPEYPH